MDQNTDEASISSYVGDVDEYSKKVLGALMTTIKASSSLPHSSDDFDLYSSFPGFRAFHNKQGSRIVSNINSFLQHQGIKTLPQNSSQLGGGNVDVDDHFDRIVEANDMMLEQISALLEQATAPKKDNTQPQENVVIQEPRVSVPKATPVVSSWNRSNKYGKQQTFKLFHAHNIVRPQTKFKDKIDNSNLPFVPIITEKPNAMKPLPKALVNLQSSNSSVPLAIANLVRQGREYNAEDQNIYAHPYKTELENLKFMDSQLQRVEPQKYDLFPAEPCEVIATKDEMLAVIEHLKSCPEFAVDLEHHSYRSFQGITCLMQISSRSKDFLIDTLELRSEIYRFNEIFTDPNIVKVFHGADFDVHWLQRDFGVYVVNMFDTGQAAREMGLRHFSLDYLLQKYCDVHADKKYQLADWRIRPIPTEMRKYAQEDTHYLLYVYDMMKNELLDLGSSGQVSATGTTRLLNALNRSREVCLRTYEKFLLTPISHLKLYERRKSKKQLNNKQLELLRLIFEWRDAMARQEDESPGYVLPNHMLFQIAEIMPREAQGVLACCNPVPPLVRQHVHAIHQLVLEARAKGSGKKTDSTHIPTPTEVPVPAKPDVDTYDDILTCPHDLSHFDHSTPSRNRKSVKVVTTTQSSFLNPYKSSQTRQFRNPNTTQGTSWDPFLKYFPHTNNSQSGKTNGPSHCITSLDDLTLKTMLSVDYAWKLKNLWGEKEEKQEVQKIVPKQKQEEEDVIILSNLPQAHGQKRHPQPTQEKKMSRHAKKKAKKLAMNSDFKPFEYTQEHYDRFHYHKK